MIVNTQLPKDFDTLPLLQQEKCLSELLIKIREAEDIIKEKLGAVRGKIH